MEMKMIKMGFLDFLKKIRQMSVNTEPSVLRAHLGWKY